MNAFTGQPVSRVDGPEKVTGQAIYTAEFRLRNLAYAALATSTQGHGWITAIDTSRAEQSPGVIAVITHENAMRLPYKPLEQHPVVDPQSGEQLHVLQGPEVVFVGQPIAVVVAETQEQARGAAGLVTATYAPGPAHMTMDVRRAEPPDDPVEESGRPGDTQRGDAEAAFAAAPVRLDAHYSHEREHHNAMEPHATIADWDGDRLTLYDKSQWVDNVRSEIAHVFGMEEAKIHVVSPFVGGAFGSALRTWPHVTLTALAAKQVGRPVRLELTRRQLYFSVGFRPCTEQRVRLGATEDGRLTAIIQEAVGQTSTYEQYAEVTLEPPRKLYSCPNVMTRYRLVPMHTNSPCPMRAPGTATGVMAHEIAMDELADALGIDPVELRLRNYAEYDEDFEPAVVQQGIARLLPDRGGTIWLVAAFCEAGVDAAWRNRAGLGHGDGVLSRQSCCGVSAGGAVCQWQRDSAHGDQRHGAGDLHRDDAACGGYAGRAAGGCRFRAGRH